VIFYGTPNMGVYKRIKPHEIKRNAFLKKKLLFRFNENGEFETTDQGLIEKLKRHFKYDNEQIKPAGAEPAKMMKCKKCNFETDNKGLLMAHYREHKKDGE
jgi:hypothetical protein